MRFPAPLVACVLSLAFALSSSAAPRTWTDVDGRTVEAEFVRADAASVTIRRADGREFTLPLERLSTADRDFVARQASPVPDGTKPPAPKSPDLAKAAEPAAAGPSAGWIEPLNRALGFVLFRDANLWDDTPGSIASRFKLTPESITPGAESWRGYFDPKKPFTVLGAPAYMLALHSEEGRVTSFTILFTNRGDHPGFSRREEKGFATGSSDYSPKEFEADLKKHFATARAALAAALPSSAVAEPTPTQRRLNPGELALFVADEHELLLRMQPGNFLSLRIQPTERAAPPRLSDEALRRRWRERVTKRPNGDVILDRIPMVDQGPKGYCVPATFERLLRYAGIPADLYDLAALGGTDFGGGTNVEFMVRGLERTVRQASRKLEAVPGKPTLVTLSKYFDEGRPVLWSLSSTPEFNKLANDYTKKRPADPAALAAYAKENRKRAESLSPQREYGHMCLLIGYNRGTGEIALSDSWGPGFAERWVPAEAVQAVSTGELWVMAF